MSDLSQFLGVACHCDGVTPSPLPIGPRTTCHATRPNLPKEPEFLMLLEGNLNEIAGVDEQPFGLQIAFLPPLKGSPLIEF